MTTSLTLTPAQPRRQTHIADLQIWIKVGWPDFIALRTTNTTTTPSLLKVKPKANHRFVPCAYSLLFSSTRSDSCRVLEPLVAASYPGTSCSTNYSCRLWLLHHLQVLPRQASNSLDLPNSPPETGLYRYQWRWTLVCSRYYRYTQDTNHGIEFRQCIAVFWLHIL